MEINRVIALNRALTDLMARVCLPGMINMINNPSTQHSSKDER